MDSYGSATIVRLGDGKLAVRDADPVIGISTQLLAQAGEGLVVDASGFLLLAGDPRYRYRPVRFDAGLMHDSGGPCRVLVCERVNPEGGR